MKVSVPLKSRTLCQSPIFGEWCVKVSFPPFALENCLAGLNKMLIWICERVRSFRVYP